MIYVELDIVNDEDFTGVQLRNRLANVGRKHQSTVAKFRSEGPADCPVVTFACPEWNLAENIVTELYGSNHEPLATYLVPNPEALYGVRE